MVQIEVDLWQLLWLIPGQGNKYPVSLRRPFHVKNPPWDTVVPTPTPLHCCAGILLGLGCLTAADFLLSFGRLHNLIGLGLCCWAVTFDIYIARIQFIFPTAYPNSSMLELLKPLWVDSLLLMHSTLSCLWNFSSLYQFMREQPKSFVLL